MGLDRDNWVTVFASELPPEIQITPGNVDALLGAQRELLGGLVARNDGELLEGPRRIDVAGLPGFRARVAGRNERRVRIESKLTQLYRGSTTWVIACQSDAEHAAQITAGCTRVLESFAPRPVGERH